MKNQKVEVFNFKAREKIENPDGTILYKGVVQITEEKYKKKIGGD